MAKGDTQDARNQLTNNSLNPQYQNLFSNIANQNSTLQSNYNNALKQSQGDYANIMNQFGAVPNISYSRSPEMQQALSGFGDFANTGGFSAQDIQDMRARGISPIRASYANAMANLSRNRELQGGYSPNYTAAVASMQRQLPQQLADATQNVNAQLAQMVQQGKLAGLQGEGNLSSQDAQLALNAMINQAANKRDVAQGMTSLYGATPGMANMFGSQLNSNNAQLLNLLGNQGQYNNQIGGALGQLANNPGNFRLGMDNLGQMLNMGGGALAGLLGNRNNQNTTPGGSTYTSGNPFGENIPGYDNSFNWTNPSFSGPSFDPGGVGPGMRDFYNSQDANFDNGTFGAEPFFNDDSESWY